MIIDWAEAPQGATHAIPFSRSCGWYRDAGAAGVEQWHKNAWMWVAPAMDWFPWSDKIIKRPETAAAGLTEQEKQILKITADLWNALSELPDKHPSDSQENMRDVHSLQCRLLARVAKRTNPELVR